MIRHKLEPASQYLDIVIVGGGLQGGLLALALLARRPAPRVLLLEAGPRPGGNHTWCFHEADVAPELAGLVEELTVKSWSGYDVAFERLTRRLASRYSAVTSDRFAEVVEARFREHPSSQLVVDARARRIGAHEVGLEGGRTFRGRMVVDARGPEQFATEGAVAYQKFLGLELALDAPHSIELPTLMDAKVPQIDGFRFFYSLPLDERRVLVEDTYYSDRPELSRARLRAEVLAYAKARGLRVRAIAREEVGVLPIPTRAMPELSSALPLRAGYGGGWFHPTTGYSLPVALRLARHVASQPTSDLFGESWQRLVADVRRQQRFVLWLNRLLFAAFRPEDRRNVLERFYRLPEPTIRRFYALRTTPEDRARILCGRPPRGFSVRAALSSGAHA